eukprot:scaffold1208_cov113-Isochrysis_galbana.AAC.5
MVGLNVWSSALKVWDKVNPDDGVASPEGCVAVLLATSEEAAEMDGESCGIDGACCDSKGIFAAYASQVAGQSPDPGPGQVPRKARQAQWHGVHARGCSQLRVTPLVGATAAVGATGSLRADTIC